MWRNSIRSLLVALALIVGWSLPASAAVATFYIQAAGCTNGNTRCSGTTDSVTELVGGASATITCSATTGPSASPGCSFTGTPNLSLITGCVAGACDGSQFLYIDCATNSNQKVFPIITTDDALDLIGTTGTPTGCTAATSDWGVGGRRLWPAGATAEAVIAQALRGGDTVQFNDSPASKSVAFFTGRTSGNNTGGSIRIIGKAGVRPVLTETGGAVINFNISAVGGYYIGNLEFASGTGVALSVNGSAVLDNIKVSATTGSANCITNTGSGFILINSEITGCAGDGLNLNNGNVVVGNYIHGASGDCIEIIAAGTIATISNNILSGCAGRGLYLSGAPTSQSHSFSVLQNTIYGNTLAGIEVTDADAVVLLRNNIVMNTNSADIVKWAAGNAELFGSHGYNLFYSSSTGVLNGLTANATEITGQNPLFTNAGSSDFSLAAASPARQVGYPGLFLGGSTGYMSIGAVLPQATAGGRCIGC